MTKSKPPASKFATPAARLLAWYGRHRRVLPWRTEAGARPDPYRVWLSEIMLQQTTVAAVASYYRDFLRRWPNIASLAAAPPNDVLAAWAGLGYYARARNLHRAAQIVAHERGGKFPRDFESLRALPGIGAYTAGAIAAIAFDAREVAVDANAERVLARYFAVEEPLPKSKPQLAELARSLLPQRRAGDFAQAIMDLGALVCTPRKPRCADCPWIDDCRGYRLGIAPELPRKIPPRTRPLKRGAAFVATDADGRLLLERRPSNGLLGGMLQPPLGAWTEIFPTREQAMVEAPFPASWKKLPGSIRHGFTHFELEIEVYTATMKRRPKFDGLWIAPEEIAGVALPTVMRKILAHAQPQTARVRRRASD